MVIFNVDYSFASAFISEVKKAIKSKESDVKHLGQYDYVVCDNSGLARFWLRFAEPASDKQKPKLEGIVKNHTEYSVSCFNAQDIDKLIDMVEKAYEKHMSKKLARKKHPFIAQHYQNNVAR